VALALTHDTSSARSWMVLRPCRFLYASRPNRAPATMAKAAATISETKNISSTKMMQLAITPMVETTPSVPRT